MSIHNLLAKDTIVQERLMRVEQSQKSLQLLLKENPNASMLSTYSLTSHKVKKRAEFAKDVGLNSHQQKIIK